MRAPFLDPTNGFSLFDDTRRRRKKKEKEEEEEIPISQLLNHLVWSRMAKQGRMILAVGGREGCPLGLEAKKNKALPVDQTFWLFRTLLGFEMGFPSFLDAPTVFPYAWRIRKGHFNSWEHEGEGRKDGVSSSPLSSVVVCPFIRSPSSLPQRHSILSNNGKKKRGDVIRRRSYIHQERTEASPPLSLRKKRNQACS